MYRLRTHSTMRRFKITINYFLIFAVFARYFAVTNASVPLPTPAGPNGLDSPPDIAAAALTNNGNDCSITCPNVEGSEPSILKYAEKETHRYKIESLVAIHAPSSVRGEGTKLIYQAYFDLTAESKCAFLLKLSNVNIIGPNGKRHVDTTFTAQPYARFTWLNGKLDKLCLDSRDTEAGANFKRSIIANLQVPSWSNPITRSMSTDGSSTTYETDHQGRCPVVVSTSQGQDGSWTVKKTKDLTQCTHRQGFDFSYATNSYNPTESRQTNPFVEARSQSTMKIEKNIVRTAEIREKYEFKPVGNYGESLSSALITTKISWVEKKTKSLTPPASFQPSSASLLYQTPTTNGGGGDSGETTVPTIIKAIQDASQEDEGVVSVNDTKRFSDLVYVLQRATKSDLLTAYVQVKSGAGFADTDAAKAVFWDGLIATATAATTEVGVTLIANSQMPSDKIDDFLKSFNYVSHPTENTLKEISKLLDDPAVPYTRYLAVGSIIRRYAAYYPTDTPAVLDLQTKLSAPIRDGGVADSAEQEDRIVASLKGLGNSRYLTPDAAQMVVNCAKNPAVSARIRVSALQTMLANVNDDQIKKTALELFKTRDEDAEIRLAAFLVFVNSPSNEAAETLKNLLDDEQSDQVGGYVTSFLANVRTSNDPQLQTLRHYFGNIKPKRRFPTDFRQYSRNYQFSQLFASLNSGYSANGDVVYSQQSYVPRSTNFALNANLFGNSFNLFKMSARFENADYLFEKAFGPRSYLRSTNAEQVADDLVDMAKQLAGDAADRVSTFGQAKNVVREVTNDVPQIKNNPKISKKSINMDFSVKMFDSEIVWTAYHYDQNASNRAEKSFMDNLYDSIEDAVNSTRNIDIDYKKSYRSPILSRSIIYYATSSGLPLKLSANADAVAHFKMNGTVDPIKFMREPQTADVRMLLKPSAIIELDGMLEVDASVISTGLKLSTSMHTATGLEVNFKVLDGQGYDFKLGVPVTEQDLVTVKTEALTIMREQGQPPTELVLKPSGKRYDYAKTFDQLSDLTGLALQVELSSPTLSYKPGFESSKFSLRIVKTDEDLKYYHWKFFVNKSAPNYRSIEALFDTPGSQIKRKLRLFGDINSKEKKITAEIETPRKQLSLEASGVVRNNEISCNVKYHSDSNEYSVKLGATVTKDKLVTTYKPFFEMKTPYDAREASLDKLRMTPKEPVPMIKLDGTVTLEKSADNLSYRKYTFNSITVSSPVGKFQLDGPLQIDGTKPQILSDLLISYGQPTNTIALKGNLNYVKNTPEERQLSADVLFVPSQWMVYAFKGHFEYKNSSSGHDRILILSHGPNLNSDETTIKVREIYNTVKNPQNDQTISVERKFKAVYPRWKFDMQAELKEQNNNFYTGYTTFVLGQTNISINGSVGMGNRQPGNVDVNLNSKMNEKTLDLKATRELVSDEQSKILLRLNTSPNRQIDMAMNLTHRIKYGDYLIKANTMIRALPEQKIYTQDLGLVYTPEEKSFFIVYSPERVRNLDIRAGYASNSSTSKARAALFLLNNIDSALSFDKNSKEITGNLKLHILRMNRLITADLNLTTDNQRDYIGYALVKWDATRDESKKMRIRTMTTFSNDNHEIRTKNDIQLADYQLQANGRLLQEGELNNGSVRIDGELILPNETRITANIKRSFRGDESTAIDYDLTVDGSYSASKTAPPDTVNFALSARDFDANNYIFDVNSDFTLKMNNVPNVAAGVAARRIISNDSKWLLGGNVYVDGDIVKRKVNLSADVQYAHFAYNADEPTRELALPPTHYHIRASLGDDYVVDSEGNAENTEVKNVLRMKMPVQGRKPFALQWTTNTKADISPSKYVVIRSTNNAVWNDDKYLNCDATYEMHPKSGLLSMSWESSDMPKRAIDVTFAYDNSQTEGLQGPFAQTAVNMTYNTKKAYCAAKIEFSKDLTVKLVTINGDSPTSGEFSIRSTSKMEDEGNSLYNNFYLDTRYKHWNATSQLSTYPTKPEINLMYASPEGVSQLQMKFVEAAPNYWKGNTYCKWMHGGNGYVRADGELKLDTADDLLLKLNVDSPNLNINNFTFIGANRDANHDRKRINFKATLGDTKSYAGSLTYIYTNDNQKLAFECSGMVQADGKNHPITFKYNRLQLTETLNGETGCQHKMLISLDGKKNALDLEAKSTDKSFYLKRDLWRDDKCYKLNFSYQIKMKDVLNYERTIRSSIDLKPFVQNSEEFAIESRTIRSVSTYNSHFKLQWAENKKLESDVYSMEGKSGFILTLPQRQIAAETQYSYKMESADGNVKMSTVIWFDKTRNENQKLLLDVGAEYKIPENENVVAVKSFSNLRIPTQPKSLSVSADLVLKPLEEKAVVFNCDLDVFKSQQQTITIIYEMLQRSKDSGYEVKSVVRALSKGQNLNVQLERSIAVFFDHLEYNAKLEYIDSKNATKTSTLSVDLRLFSINAKLKVFDNITLAGKGELSINRNYLQIKQELNLFNHLYELTYLMNTDPRLRIVCEWKEPIKQAVNVDVTLLWNDRLIVDVKMANRGDVFQSILYLNDTRFMQSDNVLDYKNGKLLMERSKEDVLLLLNDGRRLTKSAINDVSTQLSYRTRQFRSASTNIKPMVESANAYLATLQDEIKNDPSIVSASENVREIVNGVTDFVIAALQHVSAFLGDWVYGYDLVLDKISEFMEAMVDNMNSLMQLTVEDMNKWLQDRLIAMWKSAIKLIEYIRDNKDKWRETYSSISESVKDSMKVVSETVDEFRTNVREFCERLKQYLTSLPITNYLKERLSELRNSQISQYAWNAVRDTAENIKDYMPTQELKVLINMIVSTIDKVINDKPYDMNDELKNIYKQTIESLRSLAKLIYEHTRRYRIGDLFNNDYSMPYISLNSLKNIPQMWSSTLGYVNWLREQDLSSLREYFEFYKPGSYNIYDIVPPYSKIGVIMDGRNVITMNGMYFPIDSDCRYLLVGDFVNNNFTVVGNVQNGKLESLTVSSNTQTVAIFADGMPTLNNVRTDYPIRESEIYALRSQHSIEIFVDRSVYVRCSPTLDMCVVEVSGFYQGKAFGLLGSPSPETMVDLTTPDMTLSKNIPTFLKQYQVDNNCKVPQTKLTDEIPKSTECSEVFSGKTILKRGMSSLRTKGFKDMCDDATSVRSTPAEKLETACKASLLFSWVAHMNGYNLIPPPQCSKCKIGEKTLEYGFSETVKVPQTKAEIVLLMDESKDNEPVYRELLSTSTEMIKSSLAKVNINDINFVLIGYSENNPPSLHTTNGDVSLNKDTRVDFSNETHTSPTSDLGKFVKNVKYLLGMHASRYALKYTNDYVFKPDAVKVIIHAPTVTRDYSSLDKYNIYNTLINTMVSPNIINNKISVFLVTQNLTSVNAENVTRDLFGFDTNYIYTADGAKPYENGILSKMNLLDAYGGSVVLSLFTEGAVFNSSAFTDKPADIRDKLANVFVNRVVDGLTSYDRITQCTCQNKWDTYSELQCKLVSASISSRSRG